MILKDHKFDQFGMTKLPFTKVVAEPFLDDERRHCLQQLNTFLSYRGFAVVTGPPGVGKTMLLNHICSQLHPNEHNIMYIPFASLSPSDMLKTICRKMNIEPVMSKSKMLTELQQQIIENPAVNHVLILDEIQKISHECIEQVRLLANINFEEKSFFSIIMSGNDEFIQQLRLKINEPLRQRITRYCRLGALCRENTEAYLHHHFKMAGAHQQIVSKQAANLIFDSTSGIPRLINSLAMAALENAADKKETLVDLEHVNAAIQITTPPAMEVFQ
jgi:type II secretory pathway predicted ATPase ExeA